MGAAQQLGERPLAVFKRFTTRVRQITLQVWGVRPDMQNKNVEGC